MAVRLQQLYEQVRDFDIILMAGKNGMDRPVRWVHMVENVEIASFLEGQEIAFTTGIGLQTQEDLLDLVRGNYQNRASGMVVNTGPYIRQISPAVIRFCDAHDFPLFRVPWKVHMAQIMRVFCFAITESEKSSMELAAALKNAIFCPGQEELYLDYMEQNGFLKRWNYCVCVLEFCRRDTGVCLPDKRMETLRRPIENLIPHRNWQVALLTLEHRLVLVFARYPENRVEAMAQAMLDACRPLLEEGECVYAGVGKVTKSARCIGKSYYQALKLEKLQKQRGLDGVLCLYNRMGVYKLLLAVEDRDILEGYYRESVAPLVEYDRINQSDLLAVLRSYLAHSGSVKETAEELFVHRNTVNYKLNKIEELLHVDLSDFADRERLSIGLRVREIMAC